MNQNSVDMQPPDPTSELPESPLTRTTHLKRRYDPIVEQVTNLMMRDGKKSVSQRVRSSVSLPLSGPLAVLGVNSVDRC